MAEAFGVEGTTQVGFKITAHGIVENPTIEKSSGNSLLDLAALNCVRDWRYGPATQDGKAVSVPWSADVVWKLTDVPFAEEPRDCASYYAKKGARLNGRVTVVAYQVRAGAVQDAVIALSSGDSQLDADAVDCVKSWRFVSAFSDGSSTDGLEADIVSWSTESNPAGSASRHAPGATKQAAATPVSIGRPHSCFDFYPLDSVARMHQGKATLSFTITEQGTVTNPHLDQSSGYADLDRSSLACVVDWQYKPATRGGSPIAAPWKANIVWQIPTVPFAAPPPQCRNPVAIPADGEAYTVMALDISAGAVTNASVRGPSGIPALDDAAMACAKAWKFATVDGAGHPTGGRIFKTIWWTPPPPGFKQ
jgi:TonB family protein